MHGRLGNYDDKRADTSQPYDAPRPVNGADERSPPESAESYPTNGNGSYPTNGNGNGVEPYEPERSPSAMEYPNWGIGETTGEIVGAVGDGVGDLWDSAYAGVQTVAATVKGDKERGGFRNLVEAVKPQTPAGWFLAGALIGWWSSKVWSKR